MFRIFSDFSQVILLDEPALSYPRRHSTIPRTRGGGRRKKRSMQAEISEKKGRCEKGGCYCHFQLKPFIRGRLSYWNCHRDKKPAGQPHTGDNRHTFYQPFTIRGSAYNETAKTLKESFNVYQLQAGDFKLYDHDSAFFIDYHNSKQFMAFLFDNIPIYLWIPCLIYWAIYRQTVETVFIVYFITFNTASTSSLLTGYFLVFNAVILLVLLLFKRIYSPVGCFSALPVRSLCFFSRFYFGF